MRSKSTPRFDPETFLSRSGLGRTLVEIRKNGTIFSQGDRGSAIFYVQKGRVKLTVVSKAGKEATIALLAAGDFLEKNV